MGFVSHGLAGDGLAKGKPNIMQLAGQWWQWISSIPLDTNPKVDPTGDFVYINQSDGDEDVFFLADSFGEGEWVRTCEVPEGRPLFFPITDALWWAPEDAKTPPELRALCEASMDGATTLECTVDGVPLEDLLDLESLYDLRVQTRPIIISDELLVDFGLDPGDRLAVGEGYWVYLDDLEEGDHVIQFYMELTSGPFAGAWQDVTWHVTIVDE
jgi:hypothetical protein